LGVDPRTSAKISVLLLLTLFSRTNGTQIYAEKAGFKTKSKAEELSRFKQENRFFLIRRYPNFSPFQCLGVADRGFSGDLAGA
jgi:hypothetical protein